MTKKEFFEAIAATESVEMELREFAAAQVAKIDETNAKNREKAKTGTRKVSQETLDKRNAIFGALTAIPQTADTIAALTGYTVASIGGTLRAYVTNGSVVKSKVKVPNAEGKIRELTAYALADADVEVVVKADEDVVEESTDVDIPWIN